MLKRKCIRGFLLSMHQETAISEKLQVKKIKTNVMTVKVAHKQVREMKVQAVVHLSLRPVHDKLVFVLL